MPVGNNTQTRHDFLQVTNGRLKYKPDKNAPEQLYDYVEGAYVCHRIVWDQGSPKDEKTGSQTVKPHWILEITLQDEERSWKVQGSHNTTYSRCIAKYLPNIEAGQNVHLRVWAGENNSKVSVAMICEGGHQGDGMPPQLKTTPYPQGLSQDEKNKIADQIIRNHPCFMDGDEPAGFFGYPVGTTKYPEKFDMPLSADGKVRDAVTTAFMKYLDSSSHDKELDKQIGSLVLTSWAKACGKDRVVDTIEDLSLAEGTLLGRFIAEHPDAMTKAFEGAINTCVYDPYAEE